MKSKPAVSEFQDPGAAAPPATRAVREGWEDAARNAAGEAEGVWPDLVPVSGADSDWTWQSVPKRT